MKYNLKQIFYDFITLKTWHFCLASVTKAMLVASFTGLIGEIEAGRKNPEIITQGLMWMFFLSAGGNYNYFRMMWMQSNHFQCLSVHSSLSHSSSVNTFNLVRVTGDLEPNPGTIHWIHSANPLQGTMCMYSYTHSHLRIANLPLNQHIFGWWDETRPCFASPKQL